jgi:hypothetical protein
MEQFIGGLIVGLLFGLAAEYKFNLVVKIRGK